MQTPSPISIQKLALEIHNKFFREIASYRVSIFLCGAELNDSRSIRSQFNAYLKKNARWYVDIIYPEDLFDELMYGSSSNDLLKLEAMLAQSVDAVVICVESAGAIAELGAFTHDQALATKVVCILESKYQRQRSFIGQGPLKIVRTISTKHVKYVDKTKSAELGKAFREMIDSVREIKKRSTTQSALFAIRPVTMLNCDNYLIAAIYIVSPVSELFLRQLIQNIPTIGDETLMVQVALSNLLKQRLIYKNTHNEYELSQEGYNHFWNFLRPDGRYASRERIKRLDELRFAILNWKLRNRKLLL